MVGVNHAPSMALKNVRELQLSKSCLWSAVAQNANDLQNHSSENYWKRYHTSKIYIQIGIQWHMPGF